MDSYCSYAFFDEIQRIRSFVGFHKTGKTLDQCFLIMVNPNLAFASSLEGILQNKMAQPLLGTTVVFQSFQRLQATQLFC